MAWGDTVQFSLLIDDKEDEIRAHNAEIERYNRQVEESRNPSIPQRL